MTFRLTIAVFLLMLTAAGAYVLGYQAGVRNSQTQSQTAAAVNKQPAASITAGQEVLQVPLPGATAASALDPEFTRLLLGGAWFALERWLVGQPQQLGPEYGAALIQTVAGKVNKYDAVALRRVLRAYLDDQPADNGALFLLSDLQQMGGMREAALETLFKILDYPADENVAARARRQADQIITVTDAQLRNRGALAEREAFWRHISQRLPSSDRYRYEWAASLARLQRWQEARRVLQETGTSDIAQATLDELRVRIDNAEQGLQFQRDGSRMLASAVAASGVELTLLVDTGANVTSLSSRALRAVAALRLEEQARIRTAAGVVSTGVYEVAELQVQGRSFKRLRVVELPAELPGLDGLLGLDVLHQLSVEPLTLMP
jgi:predicted aspartyl protease